MSAGAHGRHRRLAGHVAIAWALLLCSVTARAQTPSGDREEERTALYRVGVAQADAGRWAEAVETFRKVIAIRSAPPALFTLGQAEQHLGRLVEADRTYHKALADAGSTGNQEVAAAAQKAIAALEPRVPRLVLHLAGAPDGASATLDGATFSPGAGSDVDPGDHVVVVRAAGARPRARTHDVNISEEFRSSDSRSQPESGRWPGQSLRAPAALDVGWVTGHTPPSTPAGSGREPERFLPAP